MDTEDDDVTQDPTTPVMRELAEWKDRVPHARDRVGRRRWDNLVSSMDCTHLHGHSFAARPVSRAYLKLKEIFLTCALPRPTRSLHLCESPGGFVQAAGEEAEDGWRWMALSLNRDDSPLPAYDLLPMQCGEFVDGDVRDVHLWKDRIPANHFDVVTADGAHDVRHSTLEADHFPLLVAQTRLALHALALGGCLVIKIFEGAELQTLTWLAMLTHSFDSVSIIKPAASRPTNSERYVVGRGRLASEQVTEAVVVAPDWIRNARAILDRFAENQIDSLRTAVERANAAR